MNTQTMSRTATAEIPDGAVGGALPLNGNCTPICRCGGPLPKIAGRMTRGCGKAPADFGEREIIAARATYPRGAAHHLRRRNRGRRRVPGPVRDFDGRGAGICPIDWTGSGR